MMERQAICGKGTGSATNGWRAERKANGPADFGEWSDKEKFKIHSVTTPAHCQDGRARSEVVSQFGENLG
jgi:hypothetical protein